MSAWGILWLELQSCSEGSGMRFLLNRACVIRSRARRSRAFSVMDGAVCLHKRHGAAAERKRLMDAVTFFKNKRGRKIHQEQQDPRTLFMRTATDTVWNIVQLFEAKSVARRNYFWAIFMTDNFLAWFICTWLWFFSGVSYLHDLRGGVWLKMRGMGTRQLFGRIFGCFQQTTGVCGEGYIFSEKAV